mmetsp:Transcript_7389/g.11242  ORF Transcript_7389/g.11242 Transcript_7389/m.11242 type:complete len:88 (-) Transcript_7389:344-607(-)
MNRLHLINFWFDLVNLLLFKIGDGLSSPFQNVDFLSSLYFVVPCAHHNIVIVDTRSTQKSSLSISSTSAWISSSSSSSKRLAMTAFS